MNGEASSKRSPLTQRLLCSGLTLSVVFYSTCVRPVGSSPSQIQYGLIFGYPPNPPHSQYQVGSNSPGVQERPTNLRKLMESTTSLDTVPSLSDRLSVGPNIRACHVWWTKIRLIYDRIDAVKTGLVLKMEKAKGNYRTNLAYH